MTASLRPAAEPAPEPGPLRLVVVTTPQPPLEDERIPVRLVLPGVAVPRPVHRPGPAAERRSRRRDARRFRPHLVQPDRTARSPGRRTAPDHAHTRGDGRPSSAAPGAATDHPPGLRGPLRWTATPLVRRELRAADRRASARVRAGGRRRRDQRRRSARRSGPRRGCPTRGGRRPLAVHGPPDRLIRSCPHTDLRPAPPGRRRSSSPARTSGACWRTHRSICLAGPLPNRPGTYQWMRCDRTSAWN